MSEPEQQPIDEHTAIYLHYKESVMSKSDMLYEYLTSSLHQFLPNVQAVEDALTGACVSLGKTPLDSLLLIHEFLQNYHSIVQQEHKAEQAEAESPYMVRDKQ